MVNLMMIEARGEVSEGINPIQKREKQRMIGSFQWITYDPPTPYQSFTHFSLTCRYVLPSNLMPFCYFVNINCFIQVYIFYELLSTSLLLYINLHRKIKKKKGAHADLESVTSKPNWPRCTCILKQSKTKKLEQFHFAPNGFKCKLKGNRSPSKTQKKTKSPLSFLMADLILDNSPG